MCFTHDCKGRSYLYPLSCSLTGYKAELLTTRYDFTLLRLFIPTLITSVSSPPATSICAVTLSSLCSFQPWAEELPQQAPGRFYLLTIFVTLAAPSLRVRRVAAKKFRLKNVVCRSRTRLCLCVYRIQPKPYHCWWRAASATSTYTVSFSVQIYVEINACIYNTNLFSPGLQHQGIFRVSGSQVEVNDIKNSFERG